jgi:hypothetical protein
MIHPHLNPLQQEEREQSPSPQPSPLKGEGTYKVIFSVGRGRLRKWFFIGIMSKNAGQLKIISFRPII